MKQILHAQSNLVRRCVARYSIVALCLVVLTPATSKAANVTANVDYNNPRQTIEGFGASATWVANDLDA